MNRLVRTRTTERTGCDGNKASMARHVQLSRRLLLGYERSKRLMVLCALDAYVRLHYRLP